MSSNLELVAFQVDEFGTIGRTQDGQLLRSTQRPPFSFDYDVVTYTEKEKSILWNFTRTNMTNEETEEVLRYMNSIKVDQQLTTKMAENAQAKKILERTDWYVIRNIETGKAIPENVTNMRAEARVICGKD